MKPYIYILSLLSSITSFSQVGINTKTPKTTLHIFGKPSVTTEMDGIIIPRITGDQLAAKTYDSEQNAALVFVTELPTSAVGQVSEVNAVGVYYFEDLIWKKLLPGDESKENPELVSMYAEIQNLALPSSFSSTTPIPYTSTIYNPNDWYDTATNRFKPTLAGYYIITASARTYRGSQTGESDLKIYKNNSAYGRVSAFGNVVNNLTRLVYFNGTTDFISISSTSAIGDSQHQKQESTYFSALYIGKSIQQNTQEINVYTGSTDNIGLLGDIKQGFQSSDHQGWIKLDGRPVTILTASQQKTLKALGYYDYLPNATNALLSHYGNEKLGSLQGSNNLYLQRNQLPPIQLDLNVNSTGNHSHSITMPVADSGGKPMYENSVGAPWNLANAGRTGTSTSSNGSHTHTGTLNYLHSDAGIGTPQSAIDIQPKVVNVNTFIFLGD